MRITYLVPVVALVALAGFLAISDDAEAQSWSTTLQCSAPSDTVQPLGNPVKTTCTLTSIVDAELSNPAGTAVYTISPSGPAWAQVVVSPQTLTVKYTGGQNTYTNTIDVTVSAAQNAPAFTPGNVVVTASGQAQAPETIKSATATFQATPGYFNLYSVSMEKKIDKAGPQTVIPFLITIDNLSNGPTRFDFGFASEEGAVPEGFQVSLPTALTLESTATGGQTTSNQAVLEVYTPYRNGYVNDVGAIQVLVKSAYAVNPSLKGAETIVSVIAQGRGFYVPGFEVVFGLTAMAGAAFAMRRQDA